MYIYNRRTSGCLDFRQKLNFVVNFEFYEI